MFLNFLLVQLIIISTLAPVYCWPKTRKLVFPIYGIYLLYSFLLMDFLMGEIDFCHDAFNGYQYYFNFIRQWWESDISFGWNPFLHAGQSLAILSNLILWVPAVLVSEFSGLLDIHLTPFQFSKWVFLAIFFHASSGLTLLIQLVYRNKWVTFFANTTFLFGGLFINNLHQAWPTLFAFPLTYILFLFFHALRKNNWTSLILFSLLLGSTLNHYIPMYVAFTVFVLLFFTALHFKRFKNWLKRMEIKKNWPLLVGCVFLFLIAAGPMIFSYFEMENQASPTRGFTIRGQLTATFEGEQAGVASPFITYAAFFDRGWNPDHHSVVKWHHAGYLGIVPYFFLYLFPYLFIRNFPSRVIILTGLTLMIVSFGKNTFVWVWLVDNFPLFNMVRHPAGFSSIVHLLSIFIAAGCLKLMSYHILTARRMILPILLGIYFIYKSVDVLSHEALPFVLVGSCLVGSLINLNQFLRTRAVLRWAFLGLIVFNLLDLSTFTHNSLKLDRFVDEGRLKILHEESFENLSSLSSSEGLFPQFGFGQTGKNAALEAAFHNNSETKGSYSIKIYPSDEGVASLWLNLPATKQLMEKFINVEVAIKSKNQEQDSIFVDIQDDLSPISAHFYENSGDWEKIEARKYIPSDVKYILISLNVLASSSAPVYFDDLKVTLEDIPKEDVIDFRPFEYINHNPRRGLCSLDDYELSPMEYPATWISVCDPCPEFLPLQVMPVIDKELVWSHHTADYMFMMDMDFSRFFLGLIQPEYKESGNFSGNLFYLIPSIYYWEPENLSFIQNPSGKNFPRKINLKTSGNVHQNYSYTPNSISVLTESDHNGVLLRMENFHKGWKAYVDGKETPIFKIKPNFQAIQIPEGNHFVQFEFSSPFNFLVHLSIYSTIAGWFFMLAWLRQKA